MRTLLPKESFLSRMAFLSFLQPDQNFEDTELLAKDFEELEDYSL